MPCEEAEGMDQYDYLIVNDDLDDLCGGGSSDYPWRASHESIRNIGFYRKDQRRSESLKGE